MPGHLAAIFGRGTVIILGCALIPGVEGARSHRDDRIGSGHREIGKSNRRIGDSDSGSVAVRARSVTLTAERVGQTHPLARGAAGSVARTHGLATLVQ